MRRRAGVVQPRVARGRAGGHALLVDAAACRCGDHPRLAGRHDRLGAARLARGAADGVPPQTEYVITTAGEPVADTGGAPTVPDRAVLSVTLGEPLVKLAAFGYGVRRALSAETRNRISFEMRREIKRARKERNRDVEWSALSATAPLAWLASNARVPIAYGEHVFGVAGFLELAQRALEDLRRHPPQRR